MFSVKTTRNITKKIINNNHCDESTAPTGVAVLSIEGNYITEF